MAISDWYDHDGTYPTNGGLLSSSAMRSQLAAIQNGLSAKLSDLSGAGGKIIAVNAGGTAYEALTTTGTGNGVRATSPTLTTPNLGTPSAGVLTNCTGYTIANLSGAGTGVLTALGVAVGSAGAFVVNGGALGTPSSGTLSGCSGLPISTGVSGLGTGVATFLATPSSANLASAVTDETGSGALVFANSPTLETPALGAATATSINGLTVTSSTGTLTLTNGKTLSVSNTLTFTGTDGSTVACGAGGTVAYVANKLSVFAATTSSELAGVISDETGSGALVFGTGPTITSPALSNTNLTGLKTAVYNSQVSNATTTGAVTIDWSAGSVQSQAEPTGTITYTFTAPSSNCHLQLLIASDGTSSSQTINWPAEVVWYGSTLSATTANKKHVVNFWYDGTNYHATYMTQV